MARVPKRKQTDHAVHVGLGPDDVMVVVDDHRPAENVQVLHNVFLDISQGGDVRVVTWGTHKYKCTIYHELLYSDGENNKKSRTHKFQQKEKKARHIIFIFSAPGLWGINSFIPLQKEKKNWYSQKTLSYLFIYLFWKKQLESPISANVLLTFP